MNLSDEPAAVVQRQLEAFNARDADALLAAYAVMMQAEQAGAVILKKAQDTFWGGHAGYFPSP